MIKFYEMWNELEPYLKVTNALEQGFSNGKYTRILAKYAKNVIGIDTSYDFLKIAQDNLKDCNNIELKIMDAKQMTFKNKSFDVILNTSFHEFDLSHGEYKTDLLLKEDILKEMIRVSNTIIFIEPTENAVTNELFKVFDESENHSDRIAKSNKLISEFMQKNNYELVKTGLTFNEDCFNNLQELNNEMLAWWADIKIPENDTEKTTMIKKIDNILENAGMLKDLHVIEEIRFNVYQLKGE